MLFNSFSFLVFFPVVTALYFALPYHLRWTMLLLASCVFYMFFRPAYILILLFTIVIDYAAGLWIENESDPVRRKRWLALSIAANVTVLAVFKYFNFFSENIGALAQWMGFENTPPLLTWVLPIGLSFHTFQAMSYTIEVYRGNQKAERNFLIYSLYVMYYPQLVAGPIERPQNMLHQFKQRYDFDYDRAVSGLRLMLWGLFKKMVVADTLAVYADNVFDAVHLQNGITALLGAYFFALQIYCDFSGYSDVAIGASRVMGIKLMENFRTPYFATTIRDFWSRWHISLSTWFRDYLYIPLGGNRRALPRWLFNLMIVFVVSGFWHGAAWTFLIWGGLHGCFLVAGVLQEKVWKNKNQFLSTWHGSFLGWMVTFHLAVFAFVFFRANQASDGFEIIGLIFTGIPEAVTQWRAGGNAFAGLNAGSIATLVGLTALCAGFFLADKIRETGKAKEIFHSSAFIRFAIYLILLDAIILFGSGSGKQFIYFQF